MDGTVIYSALGLTTFNTNNTLLSNTFSMKQRFQLVWFSAFSQRTQAGFIIWWVFISCYPLFGIVLEIEEANPLGICYLIVNAQHKVMLLVFHVPLSLVNTGPRVHFISVLHDSSVQSGSRERCTVFLRHETRHLRPLSGDYLNSWHSSWAA